MDKKTILVTGGNKGIGLAIVELLAQKGHHVILSSRDVKKGFYAQDALKKKGLIVDFFRLDVTNSKSFQSLYELIEDKYEHLDVLINNAGILIESEDSFDKIEESNLKSTFSTNVIGPILLCQSLIPLLNKSKSGRIINISSQYGSLSTMGTGYTSYRISKSALNAFTLHLSKEYPKLKINSMSPGHVKTDMGGKNAPRTPKKGAETAVWLALEEKIPSGKFFFDKEIIKW